MVNMLVIVPTRGRPDNAKRLLEQFELTKCKFTDITTDLLFAVDDDDPELAGYLDLKLNGAAITIGPRLRMAGTLNMVAMENAYSYDFLGFMGDDHLPRTIEWDAYLIGEMMNHPGAIAYGNDLIQGPALPTAVFMDANVVRTLGYMVPPGFIHLFLDNTWKAWGEGARTLTYVPNVVIEHMHPLVGKASPDEQYAEVNSQAVWTADEIRFNEYKASGQLDADADKIWSLRETRGIR